MTSVIDKLASSQGRKDDVPNQELAKELVARRDEAAIQELVENLDSKDRNVQSDCIKVLYEIGYLEPELIEDYTGKFLTLLHSRNNRMVWGGMIALSTVVNLQADMLFAHREEIQRAIDNGSVITIDRGIRTLAIVASTKPEYNAALFPYLLEHLKSCRPKDVPGRAESVLVAVNAENKPAFIEVLNKRMSDLNKSGSKRVGKVIAEAERRE